MGEKRQEPSSVEQKLREALELIIKVELARIELMSGEAHITTKEGLLRRACPGCGSRDPGLRKFRARNPDGSYGALGHSCLHVWHNIRPGRISEVEQIAREALATPSGPGERVFDDVRQERERQDAKWGGPEHDDQHLQADWAAYIKEHLGKAAEATRGFSHWSVGDRRREYRRRMVEVAALAVAAVESADRRSPVPANHPSPQAEEDAA